MNKQAFFVGSFLSHANGSRDVCEDLTARLPQLGWQVQYASRKPGRVARLLDMVTSVWRNRSEYSVAHVDVFSGSAFLWAEAVCWTLRRADKPYVLALRGGALPDFARQRSDRVARLLGSASAVTAPSNYLAEQMKPYCDEILLLRNPIDLARYTFSVREKPRPNLIWLRSFHEIYNPTLAVKVLALLQPDFPDIRLTMVGPDKGDGSHGQVVALANELGVADRCTFPGGVDKDQVPTWIARGDIFLNTTNVDNTPVSVLEAMACGLCVVSTNVDGLPYMLEHEKDSLLVPPDDATAMAAAVTRALSEPVLAEQMSRAARKKAELSDWSVVLPQWDLLLTSQIENGRS